MLSRPKIDPKQLIVETANRPFVPATTFCPFAGRLSVGNWLTVNRWLANKWPSVADNIFWELFFTVLDQFINRATESL